MHGCGLINWNSLIQNGSVYPQSTGLANPEPGPEATTAAAGAADANVTLPPALAALLANATKGTYVFSLYEVVRESSMISQEGYTAKNAQPVLA